jgi:hypothetical protein
MVPGLVSAGQLWLTAVLMMSKFRMLQPVLERQKKCQPGFQQRLVYLLREYDACRAPTWFALISSAFDRNSNSDISGILRSEMITSGTICLSLRRASKPFSAAVTA